MDHPISRSGSTAGRLAARSAVLLLTTTVLLPGCHRDDARSEPSTSAGQATLSGSASSASASATAELMLPTAVPAGHGRSPAIPPNGSAAPDAHYDVNDGWALGDGFKVRIEALQRCPLPEAGPTAATSGNPSSASRPDAPASQKPEPRVGERSRATSVDEKGTGQSVPRKLLLAAKVYVEGGRTLNVTPTDFRLHSGGVYIRGPLKPEGLLANCQLPRNARPLEAQLIDEQRGVGGWIAFEFPERLAEDLYLEYRPTRFVGGSRVAFRIPECIDCPNDERQRPTPTGERLR